MQTWQISNLNCMEEGPGYDYRQAEVMKRLFSHPLSSETRNNGEDHKLKSIQKFRESSDILR